MTDDRRLKTEVGRLESEDRSRRPEDRSRKMIIGRMKKAIWKKVGVNGDLRLLSSDFRPKNNRKFAIETQ